MKRNCDVQAVVSTCQRHLDGMYVSRVEVPGNHRSGSRSRGPNVIFITDGMESLEESRRLAFEYCRQEGYEDVYLDSEIELLPECH